MCSVAPCHSDALPVLSLSRICFDSTLVRGVMRLFRVKYEVGRDPRCGDYPRDARFRVRSSDAWAGALLASLREWRLPVVIEAVAMVDRARDPLQTIPPAGFSMFPTHGRRSCIPHAFLDMVPRSIGSGSGAINRVYGELNERTQQDRHGDRSGSPVQRSGHNHGLGCSARQGRRRGEMHGHQQLQGPVEVQDGRIRLRRSEFLQGKGMAPQRQRERMHRQGRCGNSVAQDGEHRQVVSLPGSSRGCSHAPDSRREP